MDDRRADWFHRHPHATTLAVAMFVGFVVAVLTLDGAAIAVGIPVAGLSLAALAETASHLLGFQIVPRLLTGEGLGSDAYAGLDGADLLHLADGGGGGGDGGGG